MKEMLKNLSPFLLMSVITPFYILLDKLILIDVFGCGCVPSTQTNLLNINFNANDLRLAVYGVMNILMMFLGVKISKGFKQKWVRIAYCTAIVIVNSVVTLYINKVFMWG